MSNLLLIAAVALSFTHPTSREDGTPLPNSEIEGFKVYIDGVEHPTMLPNNVTSIEYPTLSSGCFEMRTIDTEFRQSVLSEKKCKGGNIIDISPELWTVVYASSYEKDNWLMPPECAYNRSNTCSSQGDIWHSRYTPTEALPPHELQIDMNNTYLVSGFKQKPRNGGGNAVAKDYSFHLSLNGTDWTQVANGTFPSGTDTHEVTFSPVAARYFKFVCLSEQDGGNQCSVDELYITQATGDNMPPKAPTNMRLN